MFMVFKNHCKIKIYLIFYIMSTIYCPNASLVMTRVMSENKLLMRHFTMGWKWQVAHYEINVMQRELTNI